jgi:hypothetical protein
MVMSTTGLAIASLVELCFQSIAEHLEYNSDAIKVLPIDLTERLIAYMVDRLHPRHLVMSQTRAIKIRLIKQKRSCTFRFLLHGTVGHAIQQIFEKTEDGSIGVQQYGLFQPAGAFRRARWLQEDKIFSYYDIDPSDVLDFKLKETTIQIKFLGPWEKVVHPLHLSNIDKTVKTFVVDESKTVGEIAKDIGTKLGLRNADELALKRLQSEDDVGIWLVPDLTLPEQGIDPLYTTFLLKRLFYFSDEKVSTSVDPDTLHYIFCQCLDAVVAMTHPCSTSDEAVLFAALQCQICFGDFQPNNGALESFRLKDYLPVEFVGYKDIERKIMTTYQSLAPMTEEKAKFGYIQLTKSLKTYLYTFFRVVKFVSKNQTQNCLLGISADTVLVIDAVTRETIDRHPFSQIRKWQVLHSFFSIFLPDHKEEYLTVEAETVSKVLFTHIHHALREVPMLQKRFGANYDSVSRSYSRRRVSTDIELLSLEGDLANDTDPNVYIRRCPLYVEPKKIYVNMMFGGLNREVNLPTAEEIVKINKFVRIIRMLSELSHKMIRSISKGGSYGGKEREIQVKFSDKKVKSFLVNDKRTVREISHEIGRKLGIKNTDEFSLQLQYANLLQAPSSPTTSSSPPGNTFYSPMLSPSPHDDENYPYDGPLWLNPNISLAEQDVPENAILLYKKKFYYHDGSEDCNNDPVYYNLLFYQSRDAIISNMYTCNTEEAVQLAATLFQINFGDHNPNIHKPGFLKPQDLRFFLPFQCLEAWGLTFQKVEKMIYKEHRKLRGIKEVYAKFRYVQLCRSLKTFGAIFFPVRTIKERPHPLLPTQSLLLGFSRKCILILTAKTKKFLSEVPLSHLRRWAYNSSTNIFSLDFGDYEEGCLSFVTNDGEAISQYLADYIDFIQTKLVGSQALMASSGD